MHAKSLHLLILRFVSGKSWYELESVAFLLSKTENNAQIEAGSDEKIENLLEPILCPYMESASHFLLVDIQITYR